MGGFREGVWGSCLGVEHTQDLAGLVVDDLLLDLVVQGGHGEAAVVVRLGLVVEVAQVGELLVALDRVRDDVLAFCVGILGGWETPAWILVSLYSVTGCWWKWTHPCRPYASGQKIR